MDNEEEERKRRLEEARSIMLSTRDNSYEQKMQEANSIINSTNYNPSLSNFSDNTTRYNELRDYINRNKEQNTGIEVTPRMLVTNTSPSSDVIKPAYEIEDENEKKNTQITTKQSANIAPSVNVPQENFRDPNAKNLFNSANHNNTNIDTTTTNKDTQIVKSEIISNPTDLLIASNGAIDRRNNFQKTVDGVVGIINNFNESVEDFIPSIVDYFNTGTTSAIEKSMKKGLEFLGYSNEEIEKILPMAMENYNSWSPLSVLNSLLNNEVSEQRKNENIRNNIILASGNPITKKLAELAPSIGDNIVSMGITAVNPVLGTVSFIISAGGNYLDDARQRGMNEEQAFTYASVMAGFEGGTESFITGRMLSNIGRAIIGKGLSTKVLESFGVSIGENFVQEAIMDPIQETTASIVGGPETANWDNMWQRIFESGVDGVLSAIILGGASVGVASAENVVVKKNPTQNDYNQALMDTINSGKVDVKSIVAGAQQAIIDSEGMSRFYAAQYDQDGNIQNIASVRGKEIQNPNGNINIVPIIIKNSQNDAYNVIDKNTGLLLDSSPYQTLIEAQASFNTKMNNLDQAAIENINSKITQANRTINQEINQVATNIESERNAERITQNNAESNIQSITPNENVMDDTQNGLNNVNVNQSISENINTDTYQTSQNQFTDDNINETINYISQSENAIRSQNNGLQEVQKLVSQISDNSIYNKEQVNGIMNNVSRNIPTIEIQRSDNRTYINSLDSNGNVVYQQQIPNRILSGGEIRDIVNNAVYNADLSGINTSQANQNGFRGVSNNETTSYASQNGNENVGRNNTSNLSNEEIRNIVKYNSDGREISDENYIDFLVERYIDNKNISGVVTDTKYVESIKDKTEKEILDDLYNQIQSKEFKTLKELKDENGNMQNIEIDLTITKQGLKESLNKSISDEKLAVIPYIDTLIETSNNGIIRAENKNRRNILSWYYLYNTAEINGQLYGVKIDLKKTQVGDRFYVHRVNLIKNKGNISSVPGFEHATERNSISPSNINISQNSNSVKNNTNVNNKSMQNNENNTQNIQKELHNRIQNAILSKNSRKNTFLGTVSDKVANKIKSLFGIDVSGRKHIISDYDIRHIIKQHGNPVIEKSKGQIAVTTKDIEKIPDIIENYDSIIKGTPNVDTLTKKQFNTIRYTKNYNDNTTYMVEVIPSNNNQLNIKTMWKKPITLTNSQKTFGSMSKTRGNSTYSIKKNNSVEVNHGYHEAKAPHYTSETKPDSSYSSKSITQDTRNVKDNGIRAERTGNARYESSNNNTSQPYDARKYEKNQDFINYLKDNNYLKTLMEVDNVQGSTYAHSANRLIEQEIRKLEQTNGFDNSIPVTKLMDIDREIEKYLKRTIGKGHFRERGARGIYNQKTDRISVKEYKDLDNVFHELGHALDLGNRINVNKSELSDELLAATKRHGGYDNESIGVQLDEGFAEILKTYAINKDIVKQDYPKSYNQIENIKASNVEFGEFITNIQKQTYNYIHQNPRNRILGNQSIGEQTDMDRITIDTIARNAMKLVWDSNYSTKQMVNEFTKVTGHKPNASQNAYLLTRLAGSIDNKIVSMLTNGYIDENGKRLMPGLNRIGDILGNNPERINDLRAYLAAKRDLEYKAKSLKTGLRTSDSKAIIEQFYNDTQIQEAAQVVYDTLDGVLQYAVDNGVITEEAAKTLRENNVFYVPFQRVIEGRGNNIGRRGAVSDIIKQRTGSELDIKDILENIVTNSANIIKQVENNNILRAVYEQGEETGMKNNIFDVIPAPMKKIGTEQLATWEAELAEQGVDVSQLDLDKTIELFAPNNNIITEKDGSHIVSFFDKGGKRRYLQFYKDSTDIFNSLMGLDKNANSVFLKLMRSANMPLRYGATMANVGFAIPNMISDTVQAAIYSEAGFIPVIDNAIGVLDVLGATNKTVRNFLNQVAPEYAERINRLYDIYQQTGASSSTRMSQYRKSSQEIMKEIYGTTNSETLGIKESFKPLKRLMDILTYIPELSESSTRFRVFERNYDAYKNKGSSETDARIQAAIESRDATQDFGRTGTFMHEVNQLIPFSAARVGSAYTFAEKVKANPKRIAARTTVLLTVAMAIKALGYDDDEIEELNQRKKDDNFILKIGNTVVTIKKPQGILRSMINLTEYIQDLFTGHIEEGKEGKRLVNWVTNAIMDNMPADSVTGLVPNAIAPVVENAINKDFYYNTDIVKSYDLDLPESQQYYDYTSQLAIWLGQIFNYSPAKIDNLISGYLGGLGTQMTDIIDWVSAKLGFSAEEPDMGAEDNAVGKRFVVNVNENSASVDEIYNRQDELTKKLNGGTITKEEEEELENIKIGISKLSALNKQIKAIKQDLTMSGTEKAEAIRPLQEQKTDVARQALGKNPIYTENTDELEALSFYPTRSTLTYNGLTLDMTEDMKKEYMDLAYELYSKYTNQKMYTDEYLEILKSKVKDAAKKKMISKYKNKLVRDN